MPLLRSRMPPKRTASRKKPAGKRYKQEPEFPPFNFPPEAGLRFDLFRRRGKGRGSGFAKKNGYGSSLTRSKSARAPVRTAIKRNVFTQTLPWELDVTDPMNPILKKLLVRTPDYVWGDYSRGFDTIQVTGTQIRSRNAVCAMRIQMPQATTAPQPFQFRIVQGFVKSCIIGKELASTQGTSGMFDGVVKNFTPHTAYDEYCHQVFKDNIGTTNGNANYRGLVNNNQIHVITDSSITIAADGVRENPAVPGQMLMQYNREIQRKFNWKTQMPMKLFPYSINADVPAGTPNMTPVNNPKLWTPFLAVIILNNTEYTVAADKPTVDLTWSHYWQNL